MTKKLLFIRRINGVSSYWLTPTLYKLFVLPYVAILFTYSLSGQDQFSKIIDLYNKSSDIIISLNLDQDRIFASFGNRCANFTKDCGAIGEFNLSGDTLWTRRLEWLDPGALSLDKFNDTLLISGHDAAVYSQFFLYKSTLNGDSLSAINLIPPENYHDLRIAGAYQYNDWTLVFGASRNSESEVNPGLLFAINYEMIVDTLLILESGNRSNTVFQLDTDSLGMLTVLVEFTEDTPAPNSFQARRKQLLKFNDQMELVWEWTSHLDDRLGGQMPSRLLALSNGTIIVPADPRPFFYEEIWGIRDSGIAWRYQYPLASQNRYNISRMIESSDGSVLGCGFIQGNTLPDFGGFGYIFKMSAEGEMIWERVIADNRNLSFNKNHAGYFFDLVELDNGSILLGGRQATWYYDDNNEPKQDLDVWLVRTDSEGCILEDCGYIQNLVTSTSIISESNDFKIYPNPAKDYLNVQCNYSETFSIEVYDLLGRLIIISKPISKSTQLDLTNFSSGLYYLVLRNDEGMLSEQFIVE